MIDLGRSLVCFRLLDCLTSVARLLEFGCALARFRLFGCLTSVARLLDLGCLLDRLLLACFVVASWLLLGCSLVVSLLLLGCVLVASSLLLGSLDCLRSWLLHCSLDYVISLARWLDFGGSIAWPSKIIRAQIFGSKITFLELHYYYIPLFVVG